MTLYDALKEYSASGAYPFHMPGHKRRAAFLCEPAAIDITEIDGFDNLHHAEGILQEAQMRAAALYGSSETHFLVNGSTAGVLSAISACASRGSRLVMARSSHMSAYHAASLNRLQTLYLYPSRESGPAALPDSSPVDPAQVARALESSKEVCAVFVTSPTYDGVVSDVARIADISHQYGVPLIVDEAHGAHFGMHGIFPESSVKLGADLVIHSLHKTLPALTQTALIHVNGTLADRHRLRRFLRVYQTSSPSYVLMASIDQCIQLLTQKKDELFDAYADRLRRFYERTVLSHYAFLRTDDPSRILICPPEPVDTGCRLDSTCQEAAVRCRPDFHGMSAMQLYHTLRDRFHLQPEMAAPSAVLMLSSVCDDEEGFERLSHALLTLDREYGASARAGSGQIPDPSAPCTASDRRLPDPSAPRTASDSTPVPQICCTIAEAMDGDAEAASFSESAGRISAEFLMQYPPGVPLLVPGERITEEILRRTVTLQSSGYSMQGLNDHSLRHIRVLRERN